MPLQGLHTGEGLTQHPFSTSPGDAQGPLSQEGAGESGPPLTEESHAPRPGQDPGRSRLVF